MSKKNESVNELYNSRKSGAAPLIWLLTIAFLIICAGVAYMGIPMLMEANAMPLPFMPAFRETLPPEMPAAPSSTPMPVSTPTFTQQPTATATPTGTDTPTPTTEPADTPVPAATAVPQLIATPTPVPTDSPVPLATEVPQLILTPTPVVSADPTPTETPVPQLISTPEATLIPEATDTPQATAMEAADTPMPTESPVSTQAPVESQESVSNGLAILSLLPDIVEKTNPAVVGVINYQMVTGAEDPVAYASGSGFIVSEAGYVLTNAHVISGATKLEVLFSDGSTVSAALVGKDVPTDIAVLKIEKEGLTVLPIGDSDAVRPGEFVLAIGNPLDSYQLYGTVTYGIISGVARQINIDGYVNMYMQTDAAINLGNSGGPLINLKGEVIAMNTAKSVSAGTDDNGTTIAAEGIGFALPIKNVVEIANQLILNGSVARPGVGLKVYTFTEEMARLGQLVPGVYVESVTASSPAELAGMQAGDVIVKLNGQALTDSDVLVSYCRSCTPGDTLNLTVYRGGEYLDITIEIGNINSFSK